MFSVSVVSRSWLDRVASATRALFSVCWVQLFLRLSWQVEEVQQRVRQVVAEAKAGRLSSQEAEAVLRALEASVPQPSSLADEDEVGASGQAPGEAWQPRVSRNHKSKFMPIRVLQAPCCWQLLKMRQLPKKRTLKL